MSDTASYIIDGKEKAAQINEATRAFIEKHNLRPALRIILVGQNPASMVYVSHKIKASQKIGIDCQVIELAQDSTQEKVQDLIKNLGEDPKVDGMLLQLPLPPHMDSDSLLPLVNPQKDVDGFHPMQEARRKQGLEYFTPCTPLGCLYLIKEVAMKRGGKEGQSLEGKKAVVIGRSDIVGLPMAKLLLKENCTVTQTHSRTKEQDLIKFCQDADIIVAAVGRPKMLKASWVKDGAILIDVGINRVEDKLVGDLDFQALREKPVSITPVPGGVGPMTVAMLARNTLKAKLMHDEADPDIKAAASDLDSDIFTYY